MRILGLTSKDSGCGFHRVVLPMGFMDDIEGIVTNFPTDEMLGEHWDIVLFNRFSCFDYDFNEPKQHLGAKVVMDLDDDWELPASHINHLDYEHLKPRLISNIRAADLVTVTNQRLADKVYKLNKNVEVFPNALPYGHHQYTLEREPSDVVRIFWCGSVTHERDLRILNGPFKRLPNKGIEMVIGGYNDINEQSRILWDRMLNLFSDYKRLPFRILRGKDPTDYMELYRHADIMVIPLEESTWHAGKSNLKMLEAASKKIPVIVSAVEPYSLDSDAPVLWVHKQTDWIKHLKTLIYDEEKRKELGEALYLWACNKYNLLDINKRRRQCFASLCHSRAHLEAL